MPGAAQRKTQERFRLLKNLYNEIDVGLLPYCLQTLTNGVIVSPELCIHNETAGFYALTICTVNNAVG